MEGLRPTVRPARARHYARAGGPWDIGSLDAVLSGAPGRDDLVVTETERLSSDDVDERVASLAGVLRARGVRRRAVVAWQLPNGADAALLFRACWRLGAVAAPIHHQAGAAEVRAVLDHLAPALVVDDEVLAADAPPVTTSAARPSDLAVVLFTSGSSGMAKGVLHTQRGLAYKARLMASVHGLSAADAILMPAPLAHISGLLNGVLVPGVAAMKSVLMSRWDPEDALDLVEREGITFMIGPPTFFLAMMGAARFTPERVRSLSLVSSGGAGVTPAFVAEAAATLGCRVKRTYGSTEAPTITTSRPGDDEAKARDTDGRATGEVELRIGEDGELLVRGPELFVGYSDRLRNAAAFARGGWFRTGDLATIDDDGWLAITGRIKDVIIRGGENISAAEVEAVLEAHPAVRHAVAVGYPDGRLGERVAAFVVTDGAFDLAICRAWFAERGMARFKTPERVLAVESFPTLAAGKPDRASLREMAAMP